MLGLPSKKNQPDAMNTLPPRKTIRGRQVRYTLVPTLVGSMMIMMPRRESDGGPEWPETIRPMDR